MRIFDPTLITASPGLSWLILAGVLALVELVVPGVFLVFVAAGAMVTGIATLIFPGMPVLFQVGLFIATTAAAVLLGHDRYRKRPGSSSDPYLNDRVARMVGQIVPVTQPIHKGIGKVRVGDGEWLAAGPDTILGAEVEIVGAEGSTLIVVALERA